MGGKLAEFGDQHLAPTAPSTAVSNEKRPENGGEKGRPGGATSFMSNGGSAIGHGTRHTLTHKRYARSPLLAFPTLANVVRIEMLSITIHQRRATLSQYCCQM